MNENTKVIELKNYGNYYSYNWIMKLGCLCDLCLPFVNRFSPSISAKQIMTEDWNLCIKSFDKKTLILVVQTKHSWIFDNCKLTIGVRNKNGLVHYIRDYQLEHERVLEFINFSFIKCEKSYIPEKVLTLSVEILKTEPLPTNIRNTANKETALKNLQRSEKLSDVTLVVGEREFRAHKAILAAHSSVFLAMFENEMKEAIENRVVIEDISERVMQQVLDYIYGGTVENENFGDLVGDVLIAAHKYNLQDLVQICEDDTIPLLNVDNIFSFLDSAKIYKLDSLKNVAMKFIAQNIKKVIETEEFKKVVDSSNLCLIQEIILASTNNLC